MSHFIRRIFLISILYILFVLLGAASTLAAPQPNFIFLLADDMGYMDIGANNPKTFYETPNIDELARKGMRFTQGYAACPVCSPTRGSILTGKYTPRFGVTDYIGKNRPGKLIPAPNSDHLPLEEVTIAERLREAGYATFFAGKWHLGKEGFTPNVQGFGPGLIGGHEFHPSGTESLANPAEDPKSTDRIAAEAIEFISSHKDKPFFAYLPFLAVHIPIGAKAGLVAKYEKKKLTAPPDAWGTERDSKVRLVQNHASYAAMVEQLDSAVGRVLHSLETNGIADHTVVVFFSDNGGLATAEGHPTSNLPLRGGKGWTYEGGIREPCIIRAPGYTKPGSICDAPVISTDFYPTFLELAGLPAFPQQHRDGVSILPLLKGEKFNRGAPLFWHYPHYGNQGGTPCGAIRDGDWKLIEWFEDGSLELYNITTDLAERKNLVKENPAKAKALHAKLIAWRKEVNAIMPTPNPNFDAAMKSSPKKKKK